MTRKSWVFVNGEMIPKEEYQGGGQSGLMIVPDIAPFKSSVDGSMITGRAALREHNKRNNVVQTAELQGLPPKRSAEAPKSNRAAIKQTLINEFNRRGY